MAVINFNHHDDAAKEKPFYGASIDVILTVISARLDEISEKLYMTECVARAGAIQAQQLDSGGDVKDSITSGVLAAIVAITSDARACRDLRAALNTLMTMTSTTQVTA